MNKYKTNFKNYDLETGFYIDESNNIIHETAIIYPEVEIGKNNFIGAYCVIGSDPEKKGAKVNKGVKIGDYNDFTKFVTIDGGASRVTMLCDNITMLARAHVGHDTIIKNNVTLACNAVIGGFCVIGGFSNIGLNASVHPRSVIASGTMLGANSFIKGKFINANDSFKIWAGVPAKFIDLNKIGLERYNEFIKK